MSGSVTVAAPAKINLQLGVGPARPDGFHTLATVYQAIGLYDEVTVAPAAATTLTVLGEGVDTSDVPTDASNLALRAAALLASRAGVDGEVSMSIRKRIPVAGGMAGGSADAAAALLACDVLWGLGTPHDELLELAAELGSDVPFGLVGGTATGEGRGELVRPMEDAGEYWWVVALPGGGLSTPGVYREFDRLHASAQPASQPPEPAIDDALVHALRAGGVAELAGLLANDLEPAALSLRPELAKLLDAGRAAGALGAMVSGSGPTCLFLAADEAGARNIGELLRDQGTATLTAPGPVPGARVVERL
jgi:4-diphosphocytidyl-2-C-methyl-D-erythritol kinase